MIVLGDEEALRLRHHLESVRPQRSADSLGRPPPEDGRTLAAGVKDGHVCVALSERPEPITHARALGVAIEHQIAPGIPCYGNCPLAGARTTHAVKVGRPANYKQVDVAEQLASSLGHWNHDDNARWFEALANRIGDHV